MAADGGNLPEVIAQLGTAFEEFKKTHKLEMAEIKTLTGGLPSDLTKEKMQRIETALDVLTEVKTRLEKAELKLDRPRNPGAVNDENEIKEEVDNREAFFDWIRFGKQNPEVLDNLKRKGLALRDYNRQKHAEFMRKSGSTNVDTTTGADGGYGVPKVISDVITKKLLDISPFRQYCKVVTVGTSDYHELVDKRGESYGWVGEAGSRTLTTTPSLIDVKPTMGTIYAYPKATEESLQDIFFDVQAWLIGDVVNAFDLGEGIAFATGDGSNKPTGFLHAISAVVDGWGVSPQRPDFSVQYLPSKNASGFPNDQLTSPKGNPGDVLFDIIYALKPAYRMRAKWSMAKATVSKVRKFHDGFGNYLWAPGLAANQPSMLLGYDVIEAEAMPALGSNTTPIAFADWQSAYLIVDRAGVRMTLDEITTPGFVKFYVRKRVGGLLLNSDAIKVMKCATS
jgi:HK97 family phage major capsid protein